MGGSYPSTLRLGATLPAIALAREFVRRSLDRTVAAPLSRDLELIVSELFTNAVQHGDNEPIDVSVRRVDGFVEVTVDSHGLAPNVGATEDWTVATPESTQGRGLGIVGRLADEVIVDRRDGRLVMTARCAVRG